MGERINREKYIYEVAHKQRPADKVINQIVSELCK